MTRNIFIKILICSMFIFILSNLFCIQSSYALESLFADGKGFLESGKSIDETIDTTQLKTTSDYIYNTLLAIAVIVAVGVAMILGIQFMVASADEKAKVKEAIMPFTVGCIVVFGSFTIWKIAVNMGNDAENSIIYTASSEDDGESLTSTFKAANWEFKYCIECGKELTKEENDADKCSCGTLITFADRNTVHCPFCGGQDILFIVDSGTLGKDEYIYASKGAKSQQDGYCYECDLWMNGTFKTEKEFRLSDTLSNKVKDKVEEERNKPIAERDKI